MFKKAFLFLGFIAAISSQAQAIELGNPIAPISSTTAESSHVLKAAPGSLFGLETTTGASPGYIMIFDATTAPADGAVIPKFCYYVGATTTAAAGWLEFPAAFTNGIVVVFSTTGCFTKTASATAFFSAQVN